MASHSDYCDNKDSLLAEGHILESQYFYFETRPDDDQELAIVFGGYEKCAPDFEIIRKTYPYYVLEYSIRGKCTLKINSVLHLLTKGVIAGFAPQYPHHYTCDPDCPLEHYWLAFVGSKAQELFEKSNLCAKGTVSGSPYTMQLMQSIFTNGMQKTRHAQEICSSYLRILLLSLAADQYIDEQFTSASRANYHFCRKYIDENFSYISSPLQVAKICNINVRYMSRLFKKYDILTPKEYIMQLKLNKAANLLLTVSLPVCKIAFAVGFKDPYHFSRNFKKVHKLSPSKYRNRYVE
jgi:AraC-like DNA-binding protein